MLVVTLATLGGTVYLYMIVPKGFFPQEDTGFLIGVTEAATDTSFEAMKERQQALVDVLKSDPAIEYINSTVGAGGPNTTANYGRLFIALKPKKERDSLNADHRAAARQGPSDSGHAGVLPADPEPQYRRPDFQEPVSIRDAERRHRVAIPAGARDARQDREAAGPARRHHRPLHQEPADDGRYRPRKGRGLRHHRRSGPQPALQRLWRAPGRHHLHAVERLPDHPGSAAAVPGRSVRSLQALHEDPEQRDHPAVGGGETGSDRRSAADQPPGPAAGGDDLLQPRARHIRWAMRSTRSPSSSRIRTCRRPSPPASPAPRRCSRIRCAGRAS